MLFETRECTNLDIVKELFTEYSHIKGAERCFVSFDKELNDLTGYYSGGAIIVGYEEDKPIACVAIRKISDETCEGKRLFIKPEYRGKGYARIMLKAMTDKASELGFKELLFTTKPDVMCIGYGLYKRLGYEELSEENGVVSMRIDLSKEYPHTFESDYAKCEYIDKDNVVFHVWKKEAHFDDYRKPVKASLEMLREHKKSIFIVDARNGFEDVPEDVEWGFEWFLPELKKTGCEIWGFILPQVSKIEGEIDLWTKEIEKNFRVIRAESYEGILKQI
jgi:GNAT superfamily N-acetyltransferase